MSLLSSSTWWVFDNSFTPAKLPINVGKKLYLSWEFIFEIAGTVIITSSASRTVKLAICSSLSSPKWYWKHVFYLSLIDLVFNFNTFTPNYELSCIAKLLYFCHLGDNSDFRDPFCLTNTSYLVARKFIIFANYEITCATLFWEIH